MKRITTAILLALTLATGTARAASVASDNAADAAYSAGWSDASNGGTGLNAWKLTASDGNSGYFTGASTGNGSGASPGIDTSGKSWGIFANSSDLTAAFRSWTGGGLAVGQPLTLKLDNGFIDTAQTVGFVLRHGNANASPTDYNNSFAFEFLFRGGDTSYRANDLAGEHPVGLPFTDTGLIVTFTLTTTNTYALVVRNNATSVDTSFYGTLANPATVDSIALYNRNAGTGAANDAFFNSLSIGSAPTGGNNSWNAGSAKWETAADWSTGFAPSGADSSDLITNTGNNTVTIDATTLNSFPATLVISNLTVDGNTLAVTAGQLTLLGNSFFGPLIVGNTGNGTLTLSGAASIYATNNVEVGLNAGAVGSVVQSGASSVTVGYAGDPFDASVLIGRNLNSTGSYYIAGTSVLNVYQNLEVGYDGAGTFTQEVGTAVNVIGKLPNGANGGYLQIASDNTAATGTYTINGGNLVTGGEIDVGGFGADTAVGQGQFFVNGGHTTIGTSLRVTPTGTVTINSGIVTATVDVAISGTLAITGGQLDSPGNAPGLGIAFYQGGHLTMNGGNLNVQYFRFDSTSFGNIDISGGNVTADYILDVDGTANLTVSGTAVLNVSHDTSVGKAILNVSGGSANIGGDLKLDGPGDTATLTVSGTGALNVSGKFSAGGDGTGIVNIVAGSLTVTNGTFGVGNTGVLTNGTGTGHATISGGTLTASTVLLGSSTGGNGDMTVSGTGHVTVTGGFSVNDLTVNAGTVEVIAGPPPPGEDPVLNNAIVGGYLRNGAMNINGGNVSAPIIKEGVTAGSTGTVTMTSGIVSAGVFGVGCNGALTNGAGTGHANISGGTLTATTVILGSSTGGNGDMTVSGTGHVKVTGGFSQNDLTVNGGTLEVIAGPPPPGEDPVLNNAIVGGYLRNGAMNINGGNVSAPIIKEGVTAGSTGTVTMTSGVVSSGVFGVGNNGALTNGAGTGHANISGGTLTATTVILGSSTGGNGDMTVSGTGHVKVTGGMTQNDATVNGGTLEVIYSATPPPGEDPVLNNAIVGGYLRDGALTVNGGVVATPIMKVGVTPGQTGSLTCAGGVTSVYSNLIVGVAGCSSTGIVRVTGGSLLVTNATGNAVLDARGPVTVTAGLLKVDKIVVTNACGRLTHSGGTLLYSQLVLDPNQSAVGDGIPNSWKQQYGLDPFDPTLAGQDLDGSGMTVAQEYAAGINPLARIISIAAEAVDIRVRWQAVAGKTNGLQRATGVAGSYGDILTVPNSPGGPTNYLDSGAATNVRDIITVYALHRRLVAAKTIAANGSGISSDSVSRRLGLPVQPSALQGAHCAVTVAVALASARSCRRNDCGGPQRSRFGYNRFESAAGNKRRKYQQALSTAW